ncbi:MAG: ThiF family adenylyltransferase [Cryobacterium sp.]|nr:ThiF family adenylyltransferase [Oligoflexia bacterium]
MGSEIAQLKLRDLRVGVAGLGGMGSNIAEILVRLGVGHLKITDPDIIEASNLNRQVIANRNTVGMKKAMASAQELRAISEDIELVVYDDGLTEENAQEFVSDLDVIIDEIDVSPLRPHVWLHREARKLGLPLYSGYIIGMGTHIYKFQGNEFTFEDFMNHREDMYDKPTHEFIIDRFFRPRPGYMQADADVERMLISARESSFPIFGASTYGSQSALVIRMIADQLGLGKSLTIPPTPVMPEFIKMDALDYTFKVCDIRTA